jgi:hypothetical protein
MVKRLVLVRANLGGNRLVPFLGIAEERIDIEHYAAKRIDAVPHNLANRIFGNADLVHGTNLPLPRPRSIATNCGGELNARSFRPQIAVVSPN